MNITIDSKCNLKITECSEVGSNEIKLIFLKKDDNYWQVFKYNDKVNLEKDGTYVCYEKNFSKEIADDLLKKPLKDVEKAFEGVSGQKFFSICNLRNCVLALERETLLNFKKCEKLTESKKLRDFLLVAIFVLENLICDPTRYIEAEEILESLQSDCSPICSKINNNFNCNCK